MKKLFILLVLLVVCGMGSFSATENELTAGEKIERSGFIESMAISQEDDTALNKLWNDILIYDVDITELMSPALLRSFARYSVKRVTYGEKEVIFNRKLVTLLEGIEDNVDTLGNTGEYVDELRVILLDSENLYILANAASLYGTIIERNPPAKSSTSEYSPQRLFLVDTLNLLTRISSFNSSDVQAANVVLNVAPHIRRVIQEDRSITKEDFFQSNLLYIASFYTSRVPSKEIRKIMQDVIKIEVEEIASSY